MTMNSVATGKILKEFEQSKNDTGSPEVQVALFTTRINELTEHLKLFKKDNHSRQGLLRLVGKRRKLLDYLKRLSSERYKALIERLSIRR